MGNWALGASMECYSNPTFLKLDRRHSITCHIAHIRFIHVYTVVPSTFLHYFLTVLTVKKNKEKNRLGPTSPHTPQHTYRGLCTRHTERECRRARKHCERNVEIMLITLTLYFALSHILARVRSTPWLRETTVVSEQNATINDASPPHNFTLSAAF